MSKKILQLNKMLELDIIIAIKSETAPRFTTYPTKYGNLNTFLKKVFTLTNCPFPSAETAQGGKMQNHYSFHRPENAFNYKRSHQKNGKNFTTVVNYGGVSKFWCVNLKKVPFLELIFQQNMLKLIHNVPFVCLYKIQSINSYKIMWETGMLVPFGMARGGCPLQNSNLNLTATNFWPNRKFEFHCDEFLT